MRALLSLFCVLGCAVPAFGQAIELQRITPPGGTRGTRIALELRGVGLASAHDLVFDRPGIEVESLEVEKSNRLRATLRIASDAPQGPVGVRILTGLGLSNLLPFHVGALPQLAEIEPNGDRRRAQPVQLGWTLYGVLPNEDEDLFAFEAAGGTRVRAVVEGARLGQSKFDPLLELLDETGRTLARSDDHALVRRDSLVEAVLPADGRYYWLLREAAYAGGSDMQYRLHIDHGAQPQLQFPLGTQGAEPQAVALIGSAGRSGTALPPAAPEHVVGGWLPEGVHAWWPEGSLAPLWTRISELETTLEAQVTGTDRPAGELQLVPAPGAVEGVLATAGERDSFAVELEQGQEVQAELWARRLRSPLDAVLIVTGPDGKRSAQADDTLGPDPRLSFEAKATGRYVFTIADHLERGGPTFGYRLELAPPATQLRLELGERSAVAVPAGGRGLVNLGVVREGVDGPLELELDGLPPGVRATVASGSGAAGRATILFEAAPDAQLGAGLVAVRARATEANRVASLWGELRLVAGVNDTTLMAHSTDRLAIAVTEPAPFRVRLEAPGVPLVRSGRLELDVRVERDEGWSGDLRLTLIGAPPGVTPQRGVVIKPDANQARLTLDAAGNARLGSWPLAVVADGQVRGISVRQVSALHALEVRAPFLSAVSKPAAVERESEGVLLVTLERLEGCPDVTPTLTLVGLPHQVTSESQLLPSSAGELAFALQAGPKAPKGNHKGLALSARFELPGGVVVQGLGLESLRVLQPAPAVAQPAPAAEAKPAPRSRLESLKADHAARLAAERAAQAAGGSEQQR